jgi:hypothetical protein
VRWRPPGGRRGCVTGRRRIVDAKDFDRLSRAASSLLSRRLLAGGLGLAALAFPTLGEAKRKRRKRRRRRRKNKVAFNAFGCVDVGNFCTSDDQCCSGSCEGEKDKRRCQAHDQSTCQGQDGCLGDQALCQTTANAPGICALTTGNASYCAATRFCRNCARDADCVPFCGGGAACIVCAECGFGTRTACASVNFDGCAA